jgi:uncharacterized phage protein (TIGR02218 family)
MKPIPIALAQHYAEPVNSLAHCLKVTRQDDQVYGLTSCDRTLVVAGVTYLADPGLMVQNLSYAAGGQVPNTEVMFLPDGVILLRADFLAGLWNAAAFELFELNYLRPDDGVNTLLKGTLGEARPNRDGFVCELRGLGQVLQQPVGQVTTKNCRAELGDSRCKVDLAPFTFAGSVTAVTSNQVFRDDTLPQSDNYFKEGVVRWLTGANAGLVAKVKDFAGIGHITLTLPMVLPVEVGDTFEIVAGCQKRHERSAENPSGVSDCVDKFNNLLNFQGEPHLRGNDQLIRPVEPSV